MARARKRHVQEEMAFSTWGGKREGAGRKAAGAKAGQPHRAREEFAKPRAAHVTVRTAKEVGVLRRRDAYHAVRRAMQVTLKRTDFRVVHASLERDHIHFVVEAGSSIALTNGMRGLQISAAQRLNRALAEQGVHRRGRVFEDRYHTVFLRSPTQARNATRYTLNNFRRHKLDDGFETRLWDVDFYSTGPSFRGWKEYEHTATPFEVPIWYKPLPAAAPQTWLLKEGWRRAGAIGLRDIPGPRA